LGRRKRKRVTYKPSAGLAFSVLPFPNPHPAVQMVRPSAVQPPKSTGESRGDDEIIFKA